MKNQYFGDVNDYKKYGILRGLAGPDTEVLVAWMLTPDDERSDGKFLGYLRDAKKWRGCDPLLFDFLCDCGPDIHPRQVGTIEKWEGLRVSYHSTIVPDDGPGRDQWTRTLIEAAVRHDVFGASARLRRAPEYTARKLWWSVGGGDEVGRSMTDERSRTRCVASLRTLYASGPLA